MGRPRPSHPGRPRGDARGKVVTVDAICRDTGLEAAACIAALAELTLAGLVVSVAEGWRLARRGGA